MDASTYDRIAIPIIAKHFEAEVPFHSVSKVLTKTGWQDILETMATVYPSEYLGLCAKYAKEIEAALREQGVTV
jgi:hypothetical protein